VKPRFNYIDRTKGLAILLVVIGHLVARQPPAGDADWYLSLKHRIYDFHMPLFMAVSGLVYGLGWRPGARLADDMADAGRRALRLLPSYLLFGLAIFLGKLAVQALGGRVDNPARGVQDLLVLLFQPGASVASFLWYIYALALLYFAFPLGFRLMRGHLLALWLLTGAFWLLPSGPWLAWDRLQWFSVFFLTGVVAGRHHESAMQWLRRLWLPALLGLCLVQAFRVGGQPLWSWTAAVLSVFALPGLLLATSHWTLGLLETLGRYTLIIYLTNTIFIGIIKVVAAHFGLWTGVHFPALAVLMTVVATAGPILLKRHLLPHIRPLDRITS
jgi:fucose 4-O-acetylase-like acetyltransferase